MNTSNTAKKSNSHHIKRIFKVGIVGASASEYDIISRIFSVTQYRARHYRPVALAPAQFTGYHQVDFVLMCSSNPTIIYAWEKKRRQSEVGTLPFVFLTRSGTNIKAKYQICSPVNPSKLVKLLDHYVIRELNFFPEFQIGHDVHDPQGIAVSGLKLLRSSAPSNVIKMGRHSRALVVDDSQAVRKQMQIEFELLQDQLDVAESAESAIESIQNNRYDIIFLDVVMPGMDGYAACKLIKRSNLNRNTPVIMLTSRSSSFDKIKGTLAGCDAYLVKPINHNEFEAIYKEHVGKRQGRS